MTTPTLKSFSLQAIQCLGIALLVWGAAPAAAAEVQTASSTTPVLRGAGTRTLAAQALYTAKLYAETTAAPANQLQVVMSRDVKAAEITALLSRGLVANASDAELAQLIPELFALGEIIGAQRSLQAGDSFHIVANADGSTTIRIQARGAAEAVEVTFDRPALFPVMLKIWLGAQPADGALKQALLGSTSI